MSSRRLVTSRRSYYVGDQFGWEAAMQASGGQTALRCFFCKRVTGEFRARCFLAWSDFCGIGRAALVYDHAGVSLHAPTHPEGFGNPMVWVG